MLVIGGHARERFRSPELPRQLAPEGSHHGAVGLGDRVARRDAVADQHGAAHGRQPSSVYALQHLVDAGQTGRRRPREQVVQRQHRVSLATAEVRLQLHHRVASASGKPLHGADQHLPQAGGQIGAAKELRRVAILVGSLAEEHLPQIGGELRLLIAPAGHVLMRGHDVAPRLQPGHRPGGRHGPAGPPPLTAHLLLKAHPQQLLLVRIDLPHLGCRYRGQQPLHRVQGTVGIVRRKGFLVRPLVAMVAQLADQTAIRAAESPAERVVPVVPNQPQYHRHVPFGRRPAEHRIVRDLLSAVPAQVACLHRLLELTLDERPQSGAQQLQPLTDPLVIRYRHVAPSSCPEACNGPAWRRRVYYDRLSRWHAGR